MLIIGFVALSLHPPKSPLIRGEFKSTQIRGDFPRDPSGERGVVRIWFSGYTNNLVIV